MNADKTTTTTGATKPKASKGAKRKHASAADVQAQLRARMLGLCETLGHIEIVEEKADTGDVTSDIVNELCEVAKEYVKGRMKD